jgi:hypothetical protein
VRNGLRTCSRQYQDICISACGGVAFFGFEEARVTTCIMRSLRWNLWCYWSAVDCDGRTTVVEVGWRRCCLEDCWECCFSLELARWRCCSVKPEIWSGWFPLKSSPTCSYRWLRLDLPNVTRKHANCTVRSQLPNWTSYIVSGWCRNSPRRVTWLLAVSHVFMCNSWRVSDYRGRVTPVASHVRRRCATCLPAVT